MELKENTLIKYKIKPQLYKNEQCKYIASVSWGKDSLAMLLELIRLNEPLDEVVFYDTGMEFNAIYRLRDKVLPVLQAHGIKYTELQPDNSMIYDMLYREVHERGGGTHLGYSWCGGPARWGTTNKNRALDNYCRGAHVYVGIAADEPDRVSRLPENKSAPLAKWGWIERKCLRICYAQGYGWEEDGVELYDILDRVSCWCCANKNIKELRNIYRYLPKYWEMLVDLQNKISRPFKPRCSIYDLEQRFELEALEWGRQDK